MKFEPRTITLRDGTQAMLRSPTAADAEMMLNYLIATCGETEYLSKYPEEITLTPEQEVIFLEGRLLSPNDLMILCEVDGKVAGNGSLMISPLIKERHRGTLAIALYREFWGRGIGTALFEALIAEGEALGLHQLELEYIAGNERGRALYEKMGFVECGRIPGAMRFKDGSMHDLVTMRKVLGK